MPRLLDPLLVWGMPGGWYLLAAGAWAWARLGRVVTWLLHR